jgi:hypothetical protein
VNCYTLFELIFFDNTLPLIDQYDSISIGAKVSFWNMIKVNIVRHGEAAMLKALVWDILEV